MKTTAMFVLLTKKQTLPHIDRVKKNMLPLG